MIPGVGHPDRPHFDVLNGVAEQQLRAALKARGIEATVRGNFRIVHSDRFGVPASWNLEIDLQDAAQLVPAEDVALAALEDLARHPPDAAIVARVQARLRTDWYRTARDNDALAFEIGHFQVMDRWQTLAQYLNVREATTPADVSRLLSRYGIAANRTVGIIREQGSAGGAR